MEVCSQLYVPAALTQGRNPGNDWIDGWVGPRAGLDVLEKRKVLYSYQDSNPGPSSP